MRRTMVTASAVLVAVAAGGMLIALAVPTSVGRIAFGESWLKARRLVLPIGIATCAGGVIAGAIAGLRALAAAQASMRTRVATTLIMIALLLAGTIAGDELGFAVGAAAAGWLTAVIWWMAFNKALRTAGHARDRQPHRRRLAPMRVQ